MSTPHSTHITAHPAARLASPVSMAPPPMPRNLSHRKHVWFAECNASDERWHASAGECRDQLLLGGAGPSPDAGARAFLGF